MKKVILSSLLAATMFAASDYKYEVSPVVGYLWNKSSDGYIGTAGVDNHAVFGGQLQFNDMFPLIKPELSLLYGKTDPVGQNYTATVTTAMVNGVMGLPAYNKLLPYVKAGLGYESQSNGYDGMLIDAGVGAKYPISENMALKAEWLYFLKDNSDAVGTVQNSTLLAGLSYAFGATPKAAPAPVVEAPKPAPVVAPKPAPVVVEAPKPVVVPKPAPVVVEAPKPVVVPKPVPVVAPVVVPAPVVVAPVDSDKDGVVDNTDKCPNTGSGFKVDADGCPVKATLRLNFATGSNKVDKASAAKVTEFAAFLNENPAYKATVVGYTDNVGKDKANVTLSKKRAEAVKAMLVKAGVKADRLKADGKGAAAPVASNATKEGRAENRRIEVELSH